VLIVFNKPYGVLSQFTPESGSQWRTLAEFGLPPHVYPVGRLDADSEGLLLLSDEPALIDRILDPRHAHPREYYAQVERIPTAESLARLSSGLTIGDYTTLPCRAQVLDPQPAFPPRAPPIRSRKNVADTWLSLELIQGKNRQVRRMTAAIGHPTLRLIRVRIGALRLDSLSLPTDRWKELSKAERDELLSA
jgi:23S rRNA pseudouridine2457 synthase